MSIGEIPIGNHKRAPVDSRGDSVGDIGAVDARQASFHGKGLAFSPRPSTRESSLASLMDKIRRALVCCCAYRLR